MTAEDNKPRKQDPLHGITLKMMLSQLVEHYGWEELARRIRINCFSKEPSFNSSLKFLRKTPWARQAVEKLYLQTKWPVN
ncbi:VF530 family DNA-binding protein [Pseudomonadota bacterium]